MDIATLEHSASRLGCRELARRNDEAITRINCIKATIHSDPSKHSAPDYTGIHREKLILCYRIASGPETGQRGPGQPQIFPAITFTLRARMTMLKTNATTPWISATRRSRWFVICTSDTWKVMPITTEKYRKSQ